MITCSVLLTYWLHKMKLKNDVTTGKAVDDQLLGDLTTDVPSRTSKQTSLKLKSTQQDKTGDIKFTPLLSVQRYEAVRDVLMEHAEVTRVIRHMNYILFNK